MDYIKEVKSRFLLQEEYLGTEKLVNKNQPLVSVSVAAYQHEKYIKQCLDGILMQQTNFPFEIIVGEDDSKDETRAICIEYAEKYPDKIRLFLRDRKVSHLLDDNGKLVKRLNGVLGFSRMSARGKYLALCEGDDYWIDPMKLQKQVDFLENNEEYILTHSDANIHIDHIDKTYTGINKIKNRKIKSGDVFTNILKSNYRIFTCTTLFRNNKNIATLTTLYNEHKNHLQGDLILFLELAKNGLVKYFEEPMATYRVNQGSITQNQTNLNKKRFKQSSLKIRLIIAKKYDVKQSVIDDLTIKYNKILLELAYLKNDVELMQNTVAYLKEKK